MLAVFDERLVDAMNAALGMLRLPESIADFLEAAGAAALTRAGAMLEERVSAADPAAS